MELELDERNALDRFAFDVLDAGDVEEVVLVVVRDKPFHLRWVQAAVRLGHIQHGHPQIREDVPRHAIERQKTQQCSGDHRNQKRDRASQCKRHQVHRAGSTRCRAWTTNTRAGVTGVPPTKQAGTVNRRPMIMSRRYSARRAARCCPSG